MSERRLSALRHGVKTLLGGPGSRRSWFTNLCVLVLGIHYAYMKIDRASQPAHQPNSNLGTVTSDLAIPDPLFQEALRDGENRVFTDFRSYEEFLDESGLANGVLIIRVRSLKGDYLYDGFPGLDDRGTFSNLVADLPDQYLEKFPESLFTPAHPRAAVSRRPAREPGSSGRSLLHRCVLFLAKACQPWREVNGGATDEQSPQGSWK